MVGFDTARSPLVAITPPARQVERVVNQDLVRMALAVRVFENPEPRGIAREVVERKGRAPLTHVPYIRLTRGPADLGNSG